MDLCKTDDLVISANDYVILPAMSPMACMHPSVVEPRNLPECILSNWYCTTRGTVTMSSLTGIAASTSVHARNTAAARNRRASIATYLPYTTTGASASSRTHLEEEYLCKSGPETVYQRRAALAVAKKPQRASVWLASFPNGAQITRIYYTA